MASGFLQLKYPKVSSEDPLPLTESVLHVLYSVQYILLRYLPDCCLYILSLSLSSALLLSALLPTNFQSAIVLEPSVGSSHLNTNGNSISKHDVVAPPTNGSIRGIGHGQGGYPLSILYHFLSALIPIDILYLLYRI